MSYAARPQAHSWSSKMTTQMTRLQAALETKLGPEDEAFVDSLVPPGYASAYGYTDPAYPIEGRQPR